MSIVDYLTIKTKTGLEQKKVDFGRKTLYWIEPLRQWIIDAQKAEKLASSNDLPELKSFAEKIGTNRRLMDKSVRWILAKPWNLTVDFRGSFIWWTDKDDPRTKASDSSVHPPTLGTDSSLDSLGMRPRKQPRTVDYDDPIIRAINDRIDPYNDHFAFGLTQFQVERFQKILSRLEGKEIEMSEAWGRAAQCMAMVHDMLEILAKTEEPVRPVTEEDLPSYRPRQRVI